MLAFIVQECNTVVFGFVFVLKSPSGWILFINILLVFWSFIYSTLINDVLKPNLVFVTELESVRSLGNRTSAVANIR